jgi:hypothetical protein
MRKGDQGTEGTRTSFPVNPSSSIHLGSAQRHEKMCDGLASYELCRDTEAKAREKFFTNDIRVVTACDTAQEPSGGTYEYGTVNDAFGPAVHETHHTEACTDQSPLSHSRRELDISGG